MSSFDCLGFLTFRAGCKLKQVHSKSKERRNTWFSDWRNARAVWLLTMSITATLNERRHSPKRRSAEDPHLSNELLEVYFLDDHEPTTLYIYSTVCLFLVQRSWLLSSFLWSLCSKSLHSPRTLEVDCCQIAGYLYPRDHQWPYLPPRRFSL